jgi:hypothetical protein
MGLLAECLMRRHETLDADVDWVEYGAAAMTWLHVSEGDLDTWFDELQEDFDTV